MRSKDPNHKLQITIPISDVGELNQYRESIIKLLSLVEISDCNAETRQEVKSLYKLLSHFELSQQIQLNEESL